MLSLAYADCFVNILFESLPQLKIKVMDIFMRLVFKYAAYCCPWVFQEPII